MSTKASAMPALTAEEFWAFSLGIYKADDVKNACLHLQDSLDINVNMLLLLLYMAKLNYACDYQDIAVLQEAIADSERVLKAHRKMRKQLKLGDPQAYKAALEDELALEKAQQNILVSRAAQLTVYPAEGEKIITEQLQSLCLQKLSKLASKELDEKTLNACNNLISALFNDRPSANRAKNV